MDAPGVWVAVVVAGIGVVGTLAGVLANSYVTRKSDRERRIEAQQQEAKALHDALVHGYIFQLQSAMTALWYRLHNIGYRSGRAAMGGSSPDEYFIPTTLYAIAVVMAQKDRLMSAGIYAQLEAIEERSGADLLKELEGFDNELEHAAPGHPLWRYQRSTLSGFVVDWSDGSRIITYGEFEEKLSEAARSDPQWIRRSRAYALGLEPGPKIDELLTSLEAIGTRLEAQTRIPFPTRASGRDDTA